MKYHVIIEIETVNEDGKLTEEQMLDIREDIAKCCSNGTINRRNPAKIPIGLIKTNLSFSFPEEYYKDTGKYFKSNA